MPPQARPIRSDDHRNGQRDDSGESECRQGQAQPALLGRDRFDRSGDVFHTIRGRIPGPGKRKHPLDTLQLAVDRVGLLPRGLQQSLGVEDGYERRIQLEDLLHGRHDIRECPVSMRAPLFVLAALSIVGGGFIPLVHWVSPDLVINEQGKLAGLVTGGSIAIAGIGLSLLVFLKGRSTLSAFFDRQPLGRLLHGLSFNKFYIDQIYDRLIVRPLFFLAELLFYVIDRALIDVVLVHGAGAYTRGIASLLRRLQSGRVPTYAVWFVAGAVGALTVTLWKAGS